MLMHNDMKFRLAASHVHSGEYDKIPDQLFKKVHAMYKRMLRDLELNKNLSADFRKAWVRVFGIVRCLDREARLRDTQ